MYVYIQLIMKICYKDVLIVNKQVSLTIKFV